MGEARRQRRAEKAAARKEQRKDPGMVSVQTKIHAPVSRALNDLALVGGFANHVSLELAGEPTTRAGEMASMLHAKMCAHARTVGAICASSMFDHSALMSLARMMVEGLTMFTYIMEPVPAEQWEFRRLVLQLHDTEARIKFVRIAPEVGQLGELQKGRSELKATIQKHSEFAGLTSEQQQRLLSGNEVFVIGMRKVAKLLVGWDPDVFTALYSYFSAHSHSSPMSFMRTRDHKIDYHHPSDQQFAMANLAIDVATACLRRVTLQHLDTIPEKSMRFNQALLSEIRDADRNNGLFKTRAAHGDAR